jgi:hypothetical protein
MREKYTVTVDPWVLRHARRVAQASGTTVASLIEQGLLRLIAEQLRAADYRRAQGAA